MGSRDDLWSGPWSPSAPFDVQLVLEARSWQTTCREGQDVRKAGITII